LNFRSRVLSNCRFFLPNVVFREDGLRGKGMSKLQMVLRTVVGTILLLTVVRTIGGYRYIQQQRINELQQQIDQLPAGKEKAALVKDRITLENSADGSLIQAVGGLLLFVTAYVSLQNLKATQRNVLISEEKQVTERFTQAINQLGSEGEDKIAIRLGGIYALERIAKDSPKDHWTIMEVLSSFVKEKSTLSKGALQKELQPTEEKDAKNITTDVQAALTVIGRRKAQNDPTGNQIDLSQAYLVGANLSSAYLVGANLSSANLSEAYLVGANLSEANLSSAYLVGANLSEANLSSANLSEANLSRASLSEANLSRASLSRASLVGAALSHANLSSAHLIDANLSSTSLIAANFSSAHLIDTSLSRAYLSEANLSSADLEGANLEGADLRYAYLKGAKNITPDQIKQAKDWEKAYYDADFREKLGRPPEE
jgi:uncharacterized protein YjbI with pentapeptide repeats